MSCYLITIKGGHKVATPVTTREDYLKLRNSDQQLRTLSAVREYGRTDAKRRLVQMNYSCIPNEDGTLAGSKTMSTSVGMDVDFPDTFDAEEVKQKILSRKDELGLLMLERSATKGFHIVFRRHPEMNQQENLEWASEILGIQYDKGAKDITRVFYTTCNEDLIFLDDELFINDSVRDQVRGIGLECEAADANLSNFSNSSNLSNFSNSKLATDSQLSTLNSQLSYLGIPYAEIIRRWWMMYNDGKEPVKSNRDVLTFELAVNLRHICGFDRDLLDKIIPCYDGFSEAQKLKCIDSALSEKRTQMPKRLKDVLASLSAANSLTEDEEDDLSPLPLALSPNRLPQGVRESIDAVGPMLSMPMITAICPAIGALATGVKLDVHGTSNTLNLIAYIAGDFASGKGGIDPVIDAWMKELKAVDKMYLMQEEEWRQKKRAAKNKKEQPEEPKLPVRCLTLNNTVANLADRLSNTEGKHAFSFTPEADTVAQKWRQAMCDFSVMLRQSYDGTGYEREAKSAEAVNVHIERLLWNVTMCGTPDALFRVVNNYTDGFQSRIAVARTPDNTFSALDDKPFILTDMQTEKIQQIAHLLPLMSGSIVLPKLEAKGREWLEQVRLETMKNDDKVKARQRFRVCVTTQRMMCCIMLCKVAETLIRKHGFTGAEKHLKMSSELWKEQLLKTQTPQMLDVFDVVANYLMEQALYFFRDRIEAAFNSRDYAGYGERMKTGKNDSIFARLDVEFTIDQALQQSVAIKGASVTKSQIYQMLKNWKNQKLIVKKEGRCYRKVSAI